MKYIGAALFLLPLELVALAQGSIKTQAQFDAAAKAAGYLGPAYVGSAATDRAKALDYLKTESKNARTLKDREKKACLFLKLDELAKQLLLVTSPQLWKGVERNETVPASVGTLTDEKTIHDLAKSGIKFTKSQTAYIYSGSLLATVRRSLASTECGRFYIKKLEASAQEQAELDRDLDSE